MTVEAGLAARARSVAGAAIASLVIILVSALLYLPVLLHDGPAALLDNSFVQAQSVPAFLTACGLFVRALLQMGIAEYGPVGGGLALALLLIPIASHAPEHRELRRAGLLIIGWCVLAMVLNRRPPYPRVWLFLFPLLALLTAGGAASLLRTLAPRRSLGNLLLSAAGVVVVGGSGLHALVTQPATRAIEPDAFHAGPALSTDLARLLHPGDCVLAVVPETAPLAYYFVRAGVPAAYLDFPRCLHGGLYVVVNAEAEHTLAPELAVAGINAAHYRRPTVVHAYPGATLWLLSARHASVGLARPARTLVSGAR